MGTAREADDEPRASHALIAAHSVAAQQVGSRIRVLIAEDSAINQKVAVRMLGRVGVQADVVPDGEQAVHAVTQHVYELVWIDL